jgi:hypothetical protein
MPATGLAGVNGYYSFRLKREGKAIDSGTLKNVITNQARAAMARALFDGEAFTTTWNIGLIGYEHNAFGAPKTTVASALGPPYLSNTPISSDIVPISGLLLTADAEAADVGGSTFPTIFGTQAWARATPILDANNQATVPASAFVTFGIAADAACYGFYIISGDNSILLSVANFEWVDNRRIGTAPGGSANNKWLFGQGPLIAGDSLEVAYSIGENV